jgi:hypothetical protein
MKQDEHAPGADAGPELTAELRRLANLFLVSSVTLVLFLLRAVAVMLSVTLLPASAWTVWGILLLAGWCATWGLSAYTTYKARRWIWLALCAVPVTCVPVAVAYAWIRRKEIEDEVLGPPDTGKRRAAGR